MEQSARQAEPSQENQDEHEKVHCPGSAEWCQAPETDWEEALDSASGIPVPGEAPPQTSATQYGPEAPEAGTYPVSQMADSAESETVQKEQEAATERVQLAVPLETWADAPETRSGTAYPESPEAGHGAGPQVFAPSTRAPVPDGSSGSLTSPPTEPSIPAG